jgi:glycosyltransferase involved in cell wall biosynthesis
MLGVSNSVRDELRRDLKGWSLERIQTLYNRIDLESAKAILLSKDDARVCLKISKDAFVIGNVGRLHRDKDQATLIKGFAQALPQLPRESILVIMGKGSLEEDLKAFANQLGVAHAVIFTGSVPDARRFFKAFDVFALTSDHEPFGMVLLEAMVANLPIICSNSGGGAEIVEGIGDLFSLADAKSLETLLIKNAEIQRNTDKIQNKLITQFTDQAVRAKFWNIEYIRKIIER